MSNCESYKTAVLSEQKKKVTIVGGGGVHKEKRTFKLSSTQHAKTRQTINKYKWMNGCKYMLAISISSIWSLPAGGLNK